MPSLATTHRILDNGLTVILREAHTVPIVSSWIFYRVGSRNEASGMTGASHWVEHMMFKGTPRFPKGELDKLVARNGGAFNAFTSADYTCYFESLPADKLDLALQIESDRMTNALFDLNECELERTVVISEREGLENFPEFLLAEEVTAAAFKVHPYHHEVIGWKSDLRAMQRDQLYTHYRTYYAPNNAILVVVGDFETEQALARVEELFGHIPPVGNIPAVAAEEPPQQGERRLKVRRMGPTSYVQAAFHVPESTHPDVPALIVLNAVFSGAKPMSLMRPKTSNRSARLYRALVETELASSATSDFSLTIDPGLFTFEVTVRPERTAEEVEHVLLREINRIIEEGVTDTELEKARKQTRAQLAYTIESIANQAYWLGFFELLDSFERLEHFEERIAAVTKEQVQDVAARYLHEDNRTIGHFIPTESQSGTPAAGNPTSEPLARSWPHPVFYRAPASPQAALGPDTVVRETLPNGAIVLAYRNSTAPSFVVAGNVRAGAILDPPEKHGLAALTADMLERGTAKRTFQQLNEEVESVGAALSVGAGGHTAGFVGKALVEDVHLLFDVMSDVIQHPTFPESEFRRLLGEVLSDLREMDDDTRQVASLRFRELLYPPSHPYHYRVAGYTETVSNLTREELQAFYNRFYDPRNLTLVIVGDIEPQAAVDIANEYFGQWQPNGETVDWSLPPIQRPQCPQSDTVLMPDKAQADLAWGFIGLERTSPDYYPALLVDIVWGQLGLMGRLGERVRDEMGLAYYVYSRLDAGFGPGPWTVRAGVNPVNVRRALDAIAAEAEKLVQEKVRPEELADAKAFLTGSMPLRLETNESLATALMSMEHYRLGLDYIQRYPDIIGSVSADEMLAVAQQYIQPDKATYAVAGPAWQDR